jgi:hypothetical protein
VKRNRLLGRYAPTAHSTHIFAALVFASQSPYTGLQKRHIQPERYVQLYFEFFLKKYARIIDKKIKRN